MDIADGEFANPRSLPIRANMSAARPLVLAGYPIAALLVLTSLADLLPKILPLQLGSQDWRFGAMGLAFNALVTPLLGLAIAAAVAFVVGHRGVLLGVSLLFLLMAAFAVVGGVAFLMDFGKVTAGLGEEASRSFLVATWKTLLIVILALPAAAWFGISGFRASRGVPQPSDGQGGGSGLVVGQ
jgi:hypothetical protein